jgi:hypothetical protein
MGSANDREAWVKLSVVMSAKYDPLSMPEVQQLCALNLQLCEREARLAPLVGASLPDTDALAVSFQFTEIGALSWLWVLGAYEVFRRAKHRGHGFLEGTSFTRSTSKYLRFGSCWRSDRHARTIKYGRCRKSCSPEMVPWGGVFGIVG